MRGEPGLEQGTVSFIAWKAGCWHDACWPQGDRAAWPVEAAVWCVYFRTVPERPEQ